MLLSTDSGLGNRELVLRGVVALVSALVINGGILGTVLGLDLVESYESLAAPPVIFLTTLGVIGATIVYGLLTRRSSTPDRAFVRVAAVALLLSFLPNLNILLTDDAAPAGAVVVLMVLHVPPALTSVASLSEVGPTLFE
jgi:hypothetical protein